MSTQIGGYPLPSALGWIEIYPARVSLGTSTRFIIDHQNAQFKFSQIEKPLYISGLLGVATSRRVGYDYRFKIMTIWDYNFNPETVNTGPASPSIRQRDSFQMVIYMGSIDVGFFQSSFTTKYWYFSQCVVDDFGPIFNAGELKLIGQSIEGHSKVAPVILPDDQSVAVAYYQYCNSGPGSKLI
jgi:hypothetical protein